METMYLKNLSYEEKHNLATDVKTPAKILAVLAQDIDPRIREAVAWNENTPVETLVMLAKDGDETRYAVAQANVPEEVLIQLASDDYLKVRCAVASNFNTPPFILATLAKDDACY